MLAPKVKFQTDFKEKNTTNSHLYLLAFLTYWNKNIELRTCQPFSCFALNYLKKSEQFSHNTVHQKPEILFRN